MTLSRGALVAVVALLSVFGMGLRFAPPDLSSPKATVRSFVKAVSEKDPFGMASCVRGGNAERLRTLGADRTPSIEISDLVAEVEGETARVAIEYKLGSNVPGGNRSFVDILDLKKDGDNWWIISPLGDGESAPKDFLRDRLQSHFLLTFVVLSAQNDAVTKLMAEEQSRARAISSLSNVKQLALGALMYVQDYDEVYPYPARNWKSLVFPYIKNESVFHAPSAPAAEAISYAMNPYLEGVSLAVIAAPAETILIYEGKDRKPVYRYEGKTPIGFADGHGRLLTEAEVARCIWNDKNWVRPTPKPAPKPKAKSPARKKVSP